MTITTSVGILSLPNASFASTDASLVASHAVPGLKHCTESRSCDIKNANLHFVNYSSVCSYSDCNFVAAANWERVALRIEPNAILIKSDYQAAHQTFNGGLHMPDLWTFWKKSGIDGAYATKVSVWGHTQGAVQNGILDFGSLISQLNIAVNSSLSRSFSIRGTVLVTTDGFDPTGPLIVFDAKTMQATWSQWKSAVRAVWSVSTSFDPPQPPPTTTTTTTVVPTATVTFSANGGTGLMANETEDINSATALTLNAFSYAGFSFSAWNTAPNGQGTSYANGATYSFATNVTLYAQWTSNSPPPFAGMTSTNWSGYVLPNNAILTETSGEWNVPTLNCTDTANANSSTWVGIGGFGWSTGGDSGSLLQTGTDDACVNGVQQDSGWWELYPSTPNHSEPFSDFPVSPGNSIEAFVYQETDGAWVTLLNNLSTGLSAVMVTGEGWGVAPTPASGPISFTYQGMTTGLTYSGGYTAEWIVEDNTNALTNTYNPFANYGSVTFSDITTDLSPWYLTPSDAIEIVQNGVTLSVPSTIVNGGFTVNYMGP